MKKKPDWYAFQEEIARYFQSLGTHAETNLSVKGIRTNHDIDIYVKTKFLSTDLIWIIEAKRWKSRVPKEKVFALRTIVDDVGADKGLIISEAGFQRGAFEAAENTNILLYTIEEFKKETKHLIHTEVLRMYADRARLLAIRYWSHSKQIRVDYNLRPDMFDRYIEFSATELLNLVFEAIYKGENIQYPIDLLVYSRKKIGSDKAQNFEELINWLNLNLNMLDRILLKAEYAMIENKDFRPNTNDKTAFDFDRVDQNVTASDMLANSAAKYSSRHGKEL